MLENLAQYAKSPLTEGRGLKPFLLWHYYTLYGSPLTEGRGLKRSYSTNEVCGIPVAPHGGAWIETVWLCYDAFYAGASPLTEGRGLKPFHRSDGAKTSVSPLTEGRGLKHRNVALCLMSAKVAPHGGAWIETHLLFFYLPILTRRPSRRGVD